MDVNAGKMGQLIDDLLRLSRSTRGEMRHDDVDLSALAGESVASLREEYPERTVEVVIAPGLRTHGDLRLLRALLENLLRNAWKFTGKTEAARIEVGRMQTDHGLAFFVRDNGAGFDMAYVDKLFAPFKRLHATEDFPGSGIGLAIVQRVVHRHGGEAWAEGTVGQGAIFYFTLGGPSPEDRT
jgi:light-regulated signal transduction histidine kinase (bacteriophytochrome)